MADIEPFHVMDLLAVAKQLEAQGREIVHMEIGEPDFATPPAIIYAAQKALEKGYTHYTPAVGIAILREKIAEHYFSRFNTTVSPEQIIITPGASGALMLALGVLINPGDKVLMSDPGYPCNRHFVRLFEGQAVGIAVDATTQYQLTADMLAKQRYEDAVAVMLASPSNPTGTILSTTELAALNQYADKTSTHLLVDEIYQGLVYDSHIESVAGKFDNAFVINSFSKYFCMTGWRLGWLVVPQAYCREVDKLAQNIFLAPPTLAQYAALVAFETETTEILDAQREILKQRRDFLLSAIQALGFKVSVKPQGAFYLYADCSDLTDDSFVFCYSLLKEAGVAITPGKDFGSNQAAHYVRFAYTTSMDKLQLGVERIKAYLNSHF
ncbi:MAG: pyridoxal phosphate-dependent aminotransferase [Gammaproteobacteria bacterium]|nr:pyridoxal phosphate-dependent aminotransferase [Gammaproteobacteria bacterium]